MANQSITFTFTPTQEDYIKSWLSHFIRQKMVWGMAVFFGLACINAVYSVTSKGKAFSLEHIIPLVVLFLSLLAMDGLPLLMLVQQVNTNAQLRAKTSWEVSDAGITIVTPHSEVKSDWSNFHEFIETGAYFLIFCSVNKRMFHIVPKRAFQSAEHEKGFRDILTEKLRKPAANTRHNKLPRYITLPLVGCGTVIFTLICLVLGYNLQHTFGK